MKYNEWLRNIRGYSPQTITIYTRYINELNIVKGDYKKLLKKYTTTSNTTKRLILSAIKSYYKFTHDSRINEIELPKRDVVVNDYIKHDEYLKMLSNINKKTRMGFQKYIIVRLLFETGIRSQELLDIKKENIQGNRITIEGKGKKQRYVKISEWLLYDLKEYIRSIDSNELFEFEYKNLYSKIKRLNKNRKITPHMFRRGYAKYCFSKGISIYDISLSMGHSSIETTASYIKRNSRDVEIYKIF